MGKKKSFCLAFKLRLFFLPHWQIFSLVLSKSNTIVIYVFRKQEIKIPYCVRITQSPPQSPSRAPPTVLLPNHRQHPSRPLLSNNNTVLTPCYYQNLQYEFYFMIMMHQNIVIFAENKKPHNKELNTAFGVPFMCACFLKYSHLNIIVKHLELNCQLKSYSFHP